MEKDYSGMTSAEIKSEIESLRFKRDRYENGETCFLKAGMMAVTLASGALLLALGGAIYSGVVQTQLDNENQEPIAQYCEVKMDDLTRRLESNEITLNEFETLKDLVEQTYTQEYYTAVAPDQVRVEYQKYLDTREHILDSALIGFSAAAGFLAMSSLAFNMCRAKENKAETEIDAASQAWQYARFSEFLTGLGVDDAEKPVVPLNCVEEDEKENPDEKTK